MVWSLAIMTILLFVMKKFKSALPLLQDRSTLITFTVSATLLAVNWLIYIWAVNSDHIVEASLGYFINPLVTVAFGVIIMRERLRAGQFAALGMAAAGVAYLTFVYGRFPIIALSLAVSFATYGLIHKKTKIASTEALFLENVILFLPAASLLLWFEYQGVGNLFRSGLSTSLFLMGAGVATTLPLLLFTFAARNIPLSMLGILQYTTPTMNLLIGIFLYNEEFPPARMTGFIFVWCGLVIYVVEGMLQRHRLKERLR